MKSCWRLNNKTNHKIRQTPRYSFLSICFIWQSSNSDSSHSIYSSSSSLLHFNLSLSPSFYFRTIAPSWRSFHFRLLDATPGYSFLSEYLGYHQPLQWNGCTTPTSLGPWSLYTPWSGSPPGSCHRVSALTPLPSQASLLHCVQRQEFGYSWAHIFHLTD